MKKELVTFAKVREVRTPEYGTPGSAGIDFYIPEDSPKIYLAPGEDTLIPSGIKANLPSGYALIAFNKSGIAASFAAQAKAGHKPKPTALTAPLHIGAQVIDSDYQGEIHISLCNVGTTEVTLYPGQKIAQFILVPIAQAELKQVALSELYQTTTSRGTGAFGSTNK